MLIVSVLTGTLWLTAVCPADLFKHKQTGHTYHGYTLMTVNQGKNVIWTQEAGQLEIIPGHYDITYDVRGRNKTVAILAVDDAIATEIETAAFEKAVIAEVNKGPLFILVEIDSPGGRVDLVMRMCAALTAVKWCPAVAFVKGGPNGGAYSGAAALAMACQKLYMAPGTALGAATVVAHDDQGQAVDLDTVVGQASSEKMRSAWRNYMASLAQQNQRPAALARAMEDKEIGVLQVRRSGKTLYVESIAKAPSDEIISVLCPKGKLLTLTAMEAAATGMADKIATDIPELLGDLAASDAQTVRNEDIKKSKADLVKVINKFKQLSDNLDRAFKELSAKDEMNGLSRQDLIKSYKNIIQQAKYLIKLKEMYPDVPYESEDVQDFLRQVETDYESIRSLR